MTSTRDNPIRLINCPHGQSTCLCQFCEAYCKSGSNCQLKDHTDFDCNGAVYMCTGFRGTFPNGFDAVIRADHQEWDPNKNYCYLCGTEGAKYYECDNSYLCPECAKTFPITNPVFWR